MKAEVSKRIEEKTSKIQAVKKRILTPPKAGELPHITEIAEWDAGELDTTIDMMDRCIVLKNEIQEREEELKAFRETLTGVAMGYEVKGFRTDAVKVTVAQVAGRSTLSKEKLLEHLPASILDTCMVTGASFYMTKVEEVKK